MEYELIGKPEYWVDVVSNVESDACPLTSMMNKGSRPIEVIANWQVQGYKRRGHRGVRDGTPASKFDYNPRARLKGVSQKTWDPRGTSDFAEEVDVKGKGLSKGEMAAQIADALVTVKQTIERRAGSNEESAVQDADDPTGANETRGLFKWLSPTEQSHEPVPVKYRPDAAQLYSSTLAAFDEDALKALAVAAWKKRLGNGVRLKGFVGIDLKGVISDFSRYDDTVANHTNVRTFNQDAAEKALIAIIDRLVLDTGVIDLIPTAHLMTDKDTGEDSAYTHKSGLFLDMEKLSLDYMRLPRVYKLPYDGGGYKAVADAIFMFRFDNPAGCFSALINS
jgi:hypothetical protein